MNEIYHNYDAFIVDLWGVIHNGFTLYPGVINTLSTIKSLGKELIFLSNAPRLAIKSKEKLEEFNISNNLYDDIVTSGEVTRSFLSKNHELFGKNYFYIGANKDLHLLENSNFIHSNNLLDADFVLVTGIIDENKLDGYDILLKEILEQDLTIICANPDLYVLTSDNKKYWCAGTIAKMYEEIGGNVIYIGKPYNLVYEICYEKLKNKNKQRILAIGDNPNTDIKGGNNFAIDTALIMDGITKIEFNGRYDHATYSKTYKDTPTIVLQNFGT